MTDATISAVLGRAVWDSRGRPTIEAEIRLSSGATGRAIAPAGASTGSGEALDLRDGGLRMGGYGVNRAIAAVNDEIATLLGGIDARDQGLIDALLVEADGTAGRTRLGGNALVAVSMAVAHAAAASRGIPLWRYLLVDESPVLPLPEIQIFGGGAHAGRRVDIQDFMVVAVGAANYVQALEWTAEVYRAAGEILAAQGRLCGVADEGGFWPAFDSNEAGLELLVRAIERAGLEPGRDMAISLDVAATELFADGRYRLGLEGRELDGDGMVEMLLRWIDSYPIIAVEDPVAETDISRFCAFTRAAGDRIAVVGDDLLVTSASRVESAAREDACNALLVKPNQAGTLTEARAALQAAVAAGWTTIVSARSGESEDTTIVHLAVGWGAPMLKVGSLARSERAAKWNEGLRIAEAVGDGGRLPPPSAFPWGRR